MRRFDKQNVRVTTLGELGEAATAARAPAILVIGENVRLREGLDWIGAMAGRVLDPDPLGRDDLPGRSGPIDIFELEPVRIGEEDGVIALAILRIGGGRIEHRGADLHQKRMKRIDIVAALTRSRRCDAGPAT